MQCRVWRVKCEVWSVEWRVESVKCEGWSVWSVERGVLECGEWRA